MNTFKMAIVSPTNRKDVIGVLHVAAETLEAAKKRIRSDNDMQDVHFYPMKEEAA